MVRDIIDLIKNWGRFQRKFGGGRGDPSKDPRRVIFQSKSRSKSIFGSFAEKLEFGNSEEIFLHFSYILYFLRIWRSLKVKLCLFSIFYAAQIFLPESTLKSRRRRKSVTTGFVKYPNKSIRPHKRSDGTFSRQISR